MLKSMSLKGRVILSVAISLSVVAGILAFTNYGYMKKQKEDALVNEVNSSLSLLTKGLSEWLEIRVSMVEASAKQYSQGFNLNELLTTGQQAGNFIYMYIGTSQGEMIMVPHEDLPDGYDPRQRPWYTAAKSANKTVVTEPYADANSGEMVVTFATNIPGNGGVMSADLSLKGIVETILLSDFGGLGYAVLINNEGNIIAHPDSQWTLRGISEFSSELSVAEMNSTSRSGKLLSIDSSEGKKIASFRAIPNSNWFVGYLLDEDLVEKPIKQMLSVGILTSVLVAAGALFLVLLLLNALLKPLRTLANAMQEVSSGDGDLTRRLQVRGKDELSLIAYYFNEFVSKIQQLVSDAHESATQVDKYSSDLENESITSEEGVGRQMHEIEQVAAAIQEMSHTAADVANHANESSQVAQKANEMSETGLSEASQTSDKMQNLASEIKGATEVIEELNSQAQNINSILSTIQGIAEQTNLLALNAAIEAARAGEQGRGFAVVADEVRVLSQRTHESTEEIQSMIEQLQSRTGNAVTIMNRSENLTLETVENMKAVSESIQSINSGVHEITDMATRIAEASSQQNVATDEISRITTAISDASASLSESAKNTRTLSGNMNTTASQLNNHLNKFKL